MQTARIALKNISVLGFSNIIISILGALILIYTARLLGESEFGKYSFAITYTSLFLVFSDFGTSQLIVREIARNKDLANIYVANTLIIKIFTSLISIALMISIIDVLNYPSDMVYVVFLFGIYIILDSFALTIRSVFQSFEKMEYIAITTTIQKLLLALATFFLLHTNYSLIKLGYLYVLVGLIDLFFGFVLLYNKFLNIKWNINITLWKRLIIESIPFSLNALFSLLFFRIDTVMLSMIKGDIAVGEYSAASNPLLSLCGIISSVVVFVLYPIMSRFFFQPNDSLKKLTIISSKYMALIGFPISVGCFILADKFISIIYANQYANSIVSFQILSLFVPLRLVSVVIGTLISSINKQKTRTLIVGISALFNIILNLALIPKMASTGACIATVLSELILYLMLVHIANTHFRELNILKYYMKPLISSILMGIIILIFNSSNIIVTMMIAAIAYVISLAALRTFEQEDMELLNIILKRNKHAK